MSEASITVEEAGGGRVLRFAGPMLVANLEALRRGLGSVPGDGAVTIDLSGAGAMDTAGAWLIVTLRRRLAAEGVAVRVEGASEKQALIIETVEKALPTEVEPSARQGGFVAWLGSYGETVVSGIQVVREMTAFGGQIVACFAATLVRPWRLRVTSLVFHMQDAGLRAVPIVTLMAFLIGVVLAFMGSVQLRAFGAEIFVVDLIAITVLRELGLLMAAIIVAGRTASAYAAAIGSMKLREEIDAMRTLSLDPIETLMLPRVLALIITLPLLGFLADIAGLVGGALMCWIQLGISPALFVARLTESSDPWNFLVGIIQAPFFGAIIGLVGCYQGMKVEKSAESLGARTSDAVVLAIFMVIVINAAFSVFFMQVGV